MTSCIHPHHSSLINHSSCDPAFPTFTSPIRRTRSLPRTVRWPSQAVVGSAAWAVVAGGAARSGVLGRARDRRVLQRLGVAADQERPAGADRPKTGLGRLVAFAAVGSSLRPPTGWSTAACVRNEARQFSSLWLRYLTHDEPQKAHQLTVPPQNRQPLDDHLWNYYRNKPASRQALEGYVQIAAGAHSAGLGAKGQSCDSTRRPSQVA